MSKLLHLSPLATVAVVLVLLCSTGSSRAQTRDDAAAPKARSAAVAAPLPLIDLDGYKRILAKYRGKPLVVTFWATWCEPCRDEFPNLVALAKQYGPQGLATFGVSLDDDADLNLVRHFLERNQPGFPSYRQKPGIDVDQFYVGVNPDWKGTMPETIFYGRDGHIVVHFVGEQTRMTFEQAIRTILASPGASSESRHPLEGR